MQTRIQREWEVEIERGEEANEKKELPLIQKTLGLIESERDICSQCDRAQ